MGITYNSFMKYRNDASLYASLNDDNKRKFWEYAETNKLAPLKLSESLAAEKNKYVRPGFVNPRYLETDLDTKAYGMDKGQIKATEDIMRKQTTAYKPDEIATRKAEEAKRMSATNVANAPKMPGIMPGFLPKAPVYKPFEKVTQPKVIPISDPLNIRPSLPTIIKTVPTLPNTPVEQPFSSKYATQSGRSPLLDKFKADEVASFNSSVLKKQQDKEEQRRIASAKSKLDSIQAEIKKLQKEQGLFGTKNASKIATLFNQSQALKLEADPKTTRFIQSATSGAYGALADTRTDTQGIKQSEAFKTVGALPGYESSDIGGKIAQGLASYMGAGAVIRAVPAVANAAGIFGKFGTNVISKLPGGASLVGKVGAEETAKFVGQQGVDFLIDRIVQEPQAVFKAIREDEGLDEYAKGALERSALDILFNLSIGISGEKVSQAIKDRARRSLASQAGINQMRQAGVKPDDVLKALDGDVDAIKRVQEIFAMPRQTGIDTPITRQLGEEPIPQLARQAEQATIDKTTTNAIEAFQNWRKQNFGGATGEVSPSDLKALQELYLESTGIDIRKVIESGAERQRMADVALGGESKLVSQKPIEAAENELKILGTRVRSGEISQPEADVIAKSIIEETKPLQNMPKIETGAPNIASIKTPEIGESIGSVIGTVVRSDVTGQPLKSRLEDVDKLATTTNEARQSIASQVIKDDFEGAVTLLKEGDQFSSRIEPFMAKDAVTKLQEMGRYDDALDVVESIAKKGRASGQDIQSFSTWNALTPEGMARWAVRTQEKAGLPVDRELVKSVMAKTKELQSSTAESMAKEISRGTKFNLTFFSKNLLTKETLNVIRNSKKSVSDIAKSLDKRFTTLGIKVPKESIQEIAISLKNASTLNKDQLTSLVEGVLKDSNVSNSAINRVLGRYNFEELKALNTALVMKSVTDTLPTNLGKQLSTVQAISHLLNGRTFMRNIVGNTSSMAAEMISKIPASMADRALSLYTKNRSIIATMPKFKQAIKEGIDQGAKSIDEILLGVQRVNNDKYDMFFGSSFKNPVGKAAEKALSLSLVAPDELFKGFAKADSLYNQVYARIGKEVKDWDFKKILEKATPEEIKAAGDESRFATFQNDSFLSSVFSNIKSTLNRIPVIPYKGMKKLGESQDFGVGDLVFKYTKVPGNIITRGVEYSPLGYLKFAHSLGKAMAAKGSISPALQRQISMQFGRATTGTGLLALGGWLQNMGVITGVDKTVDFDAQALDKAEGLGNYKLNMSALERMIKGQEPTKQDGDYIVSYDWLQPLGTPLAVGAKVSAQSEDGKFGINDLSAIGKSTIEEALDIPALYTLKSMFYEAQGEGNAFDVMSIPLKDAIPGFIPSPVRQVAQYIDPTVREAKTIKEKVMANLPGLSKQLLPKVDPTGKEIRRDQNLFDAFLNPATKTTYKPIAYADNVRNIAKLSGNDSVFPDRKAPTSVTNKKVKFILTPAEKVAWMKTEGSEVDRLYNKNLKFKDADTEREAIKLAKLLETLKAKASEKAKKELLNNRK